MTLPLQMKFASGLVLVILFIAGLAAILFHERRKVCAIEEDMRKMRAMRIAADSLHGRIILLATLGESVAGWDRADYEAYRRERLAADSVLQAVKPLCAGYINPEQVDTLRNLLAEKEKHLLNVMEAMESRNSADRQFARHLPLAQYVKVTTIKRRKSGLAGLLGAKKSVQVVSGTGELERLGQSVVARQGEHVRAVEETIDSLQADNGMLNKSFGGFIAKLDGRVVDVIRMREERIGEAYMTSYRLYVATTIVCVLLCIALFLFIRHDIRKERKAKELLEKSLRENEELLELRKHVMLTVTHDVRGPVGNIANCAELALMTTAKKRREGYLDSIRRSCSHILRLLGDVLDVYRINEARETRVDVPFRLSRFLSLVTDEFSRKANDKALAFDVCSTGTDVIVKGDPDKMERILNNLLTNAIKFTKAGSVSLRSVYAAGTLTVEVGDTGIGMDEETLRRVFRPFERAAVDVNSEGFGLGLSITEGLVRALDGSIDVASMPGKGSTFTVRLPLPETDEDEAEEDEMPDPASPLPKSVLVVDDDPILRKVVEDMFSRNGVECTTCKDAAEAVQAMRKKDYGLVVTDIQMPGTDGFALLRLLRSSDIGASRTVPVAAMTARGDGGDEAYTDAGFCGCLRKPFTMKGLMAFAASMAANAESMPRFDFTGLLANTGDRKAILELVIRQSENDRDELVSAAAAADRKAIRCILHRMSAAWEFMGAGRYLDELRDAVHDANISDIGINGHTAAVVSMIDVLIGQTTKIMEEA